MSKRFYVIAGEASGDLHAGNLMKEMLILDASVQFRFWGGDNMQKVAGKPVKHISELAFMGFWEVITNIRTIFKNIRFCKEDILQYQPDKLILIDYPGFNLRIAKWAKEQGIEVVYYISPQVWAWKQSRVHTIKKVVDNMYVILPFEKDFYAQFNMDVEYVGHPLLDAVHQFSPNCANITQFQEKQQLQQKPILALLPGSRKQEVKKKLPIMLKAANHFPEYQCVIAGAPSLEEEFYAPMLSEDTSIVYGETYNLLHFATIALVTSGTATLETALFKVPQVVCYKGSSFSYMIAKNLVKVDYISLVNLILDKEAVRELIQGECTVKNIRKELQKIVLNGRGRTEMLQNYTELIEILGGGGASKRVAEALLGR